MLEEIVKKEKKKEEEEDLPGSLTVDGDAMFSKDTIEEGGEREGKYRKIRGKLSGRMEI